MMGKQKSNAPVTLPVHLNKAIKRFEDAAIAWSWNGSADAEDRPGIEAEYEAAKLNLRNKFKDLL